jgi:hypothetical protein
VQSGSSANRRMISSAVVCWRHCGSQAPNDVAARCATKPRLLTALPPYTPPRKAARRTRKPVAFANMDNGSRRAAEDVQFLVVSRCRCAVAGLVLFVVGHSTS